MNSNMVIVAAMAVMLIGATAFATDSAFADGKKKYGSSQAYSQKNDCGNGVMAMYVVCQNTGAQVDGDKNAVALDSSFRQGEDFKDKKDRGHDGDGSHGGHDDGGYGGGNNGDGYDEVIVS